MAAELDLRPSKQLGQHFVHDANTIRRVVKLAGLTPADVVLEVGPGLGSLTLGLLDAGTWVLAVEVDPVLSARLPATVAAHAPGARERLTVCTADALRIRGEALRLSPSVLVANLPYNVAVPVVLHLLAELPGLRRALIMVQTEVADRMAASPGSRTYGAPSVKLAWYGRTRKVSAVPRSVFWPVPGVDSALVAFERDDPVSTVQRDTVFSCVDAAFAQRRKSLRGALAGWAGSRTRATELLTAAGIDPASRGETLTVHDFARIVQAQ